MTSPSSGAPHTGASEQREAVAAFAARPDLQARLLSEARARINRVRKTIGYELLPSSDLPPLILSAISFGYYRALITRFAADKGLTQEWWIEQRRKFGRNGRDRTCDFEVVCAHFPEFHDYAPQITDDELIEHAKREFRDMIAAPGTDYGQAEWRNRLRRDDDKKKGYDKHQPDRTHKTYSSYHVALRDGTRSTTTALTPNIVDPQAQERVENVLYYNMLEDNQHVLGPARTYIAAVALEKFGTGGLFWFFEWQFFPKQYTELMRFLGMTEIQLGVTEFERQKRDMVRKIPQIHERMMHILRRDHEMLALKEMVWGQEDAA